MFSSVYVLVSENLHTSWTSGKAQVNSWQEEQRRGNASHKRNRRNRSECISARDDARWKEIHSAKVPPASQEHKSQRFTSWLTLWLPVREEQRQLLLERLPANMKSEKIQGRSLLGIFSEYEVRRHNFPKHHYCVASTDWISTEKPLLKPLSPKLQNEATGYWSPNLSLWLPLLPLCA